MQICKFQLLLWNHQMTNVTNFWVCMCFLCGERHFTLNKHRRKRFTLPDSCCSWSASNLAFFVADFDTEAAGSSWNARTLIIYLVNREIFKVYSLLGNKFTEQKLLLCAFLTFRTFASLLNRLKSNFVPTPNFRNKSNPSMLPEVYK